MSLILDRILVNRGQKCNIHSASASWAAMAADPLTCLRPECDFPTHGRYTQGVVQKQGIVTHKEESK